MIYFDFYRKYVNKFLKIIKYFIKKINNFKIIFAVKDLSALKNETDSFEIEKSKEEKFVAPFAKKFTCF